MSVPGATFDLASARRERYERPGALPEVELGATLREDLERRDFTVNAIALHLADGELIWVPRAHEDLDARRLRVLHDRSFIDDPTRLLRLVRYAARLGFEPEERTDGLAAEAIAGGALDTVTGSRLGAELRLLLREPQPAALMGLERHGLGRALLGDAFAPDERRIAVAHELGGPLAALASTLVGADDMRPVLDRLAFPANERDAVADRCAARVARGRPDRPGPVRDGGGRADDRRGRCGVRCAASVPRRSPSRARWDRSTPRGAGSTTSATGGSPSTATTLWPPACRGRRSARGSTAAMEAMLEGRADTREEQLAAALG